MEDIAMSAVSFLLGRLSEEANLLRGVRTQVKDIETELWNVKTYLTTGGASIDKAWVDKLTELAYDFEDCIDTYRLCIAPQSNEDGSVGFVDKALRFLKTLPRRYKIAKEIEAIKAEAKSLHDVRSRYPRQPGSSTRQDSLQRSNDAPSTPPCLDKDQLVGMEERKKKLMQLLLRGDKLTVISVVGMGGSGKTTVARNLFEDEVVNDIFTHVAWSDVPRGRSDCQVLLRDLIRKLFPQEWGDRHQVPESVGELQLVRELNRLLLNKKYMIILDDVRKKSVWEHIAGAFPDSKNGSRVMITSQIHDIASYSINSCRYLTREYQLPYLRDDEAWRLFCWRAFRANAEFACPPHLKDVAERIVERCDRLPLAIVTVGCLLANKPQTLNEWKRLHDSLIPELQSNERLGTVQRILSLGYDDLPAHLKPCFLCFGAFPVIKPTRLIRIWIAEGFVQGGKQEEVAMDYLKELADRSMVQVSALDPLGRTKFCHVHGFMREILESKCMEQNFFSLFHEQHGGTLPANQNNNQHGLASPAPTSRKIRRLSVRGSSQMYEDMPSPLKRTKWSSSLRSLIIAISGQTPILVPSPDLSCKFVMLRVLDLEGTNVSELTGRIASCSLLKYLNLRNTNLGSLPKSLGKLLTLETLDLRGTQITTLPDEVTNLHRLRHLLVPCPTSTPKTGATMHAAWYKFAAWSGVKVPTGVGRLRNLVNLALFDIGRDVGVLRDMQNLTQLRKLGVRYVRREDGKQLCHAINKMSCLRSLVIHSVGTDEYLDLQSLSSPWLLEHLFLAGPLGKLPNWYQSLHSIVKIVLMGSRLMDDLFDAFQGLPDLTHLSLIEAFAGRHLCSSNNEGFKKLKVLHLSMLDELESVTVAEGAMPALRKLSIWYCGALEQVPSGIEHLSSLKDLHLLGMHEEFIRNLRDGGTDRGKVKRIPIIRSSTFFKSQDGDWSRWIDENLSAPEMEEGEGEGRGSFMELDSGDITIWTNRSTNLDS